MLRIPLLRAGRPYDSLTTHSLTDVRTGEVIAEMSVANSGLIARDLGAAHDNRQALESFRVRDIFEISSRAAKLFMEADLPVGDMEQSPQRYLEQLSATTGMPQALGRANMEKIRFVMAEMETVLGGLTRGVDPSVIDRGWTLEEGRCISFRREADSLGVILPSNSPGVHSLWIPSLALKVPLVLKPGSREPWSPFRIAQAYLAAGCPPEAISFYPTDYSGSSEILLRCGRSMLFGDRTTVEPWEGDPRVQIHGPGWSKVVLAGEAAQRWSEYLDLMVDSIAKNGGRSCINASGIWTTSEGFALAEALAKRLARIEALPLDHPDASLAAFPDSRIAERLSAHIDSQLSRPGAEDLTARFRSGGRVAHVDGCAFLLPTLIYCSDPGHPLTQAEYLFPFATVVELDQASLVESMGSSLVVTAITEDPTFRQRLLTASHIERLNLGPYSTCTVCWDQPHEGNLFEHLYRQRALQTPEIPTRPPSSSARQSATSGQA